MARLKSHLELKKPPKVGFISNYQNEVLVRNAKSIIEIGKLQENDKTSQGYIYIKKGKIITLKKIDKK